MTETRDDPLHSLFTRLDAARAGGEAEGRAADERAFLCFWLGGEEYGIDILEIREISKVRVVTPVPRVSRDVVGVMTLRGEMVAVIDLRARLGLAPAESPFVSRRILVVKRDGELIGLQVDAVSDVARLPAAAIEAPPPMKPPAGDVGGRSMIDCVIGVGRVENRTLILLSLDAVMGLETRGVS